MRRTGLSVVTALALLLSASAAQAATTRFVAKTGSDSANTCTASASPCLTIAHAMSAATGGDTISIGAGTFAETLNVTKDLTFSGAGVQTFIDANAAASPGIAMDITDQAVTLENLRIRGGLSPASGGTEEPTIVSSSSSASSLTVDHCTIEQAPATSPALAGAAVQFSGSTVTLAISSSAITGFNVGVESTGAGTVAIRGSTVSVPLTGNTLATTVDGVPLTVTDSTLTGAFGIEDGDSDITMQRTSVRASSVGVKLTDDFRGAHVTLRDSVVAPGNGQLTTGIEINGAGGSGTLRPVVTLIGDSILSRADGGTAALDTTIAKADTTVVARNTILRAIDPGSGTDEDDIATGATNPIRWDIESSAFTTTSGPAIPLPGSGTNVDAVPHFVDDTGTDLHLEATSTLFDRGDAAQVTAGETDLDGNPRSLSHNCFSTVAVPDIGAYEARPLCLAPPTGGILTAQPTPTTTAAPPAPPAPAPPPPATPAATDRTKPTLSKLSFHSARFTVRHHSKLHLTLSEAASVNVDVQVAHHHSHHKPTTYATIGSVTYHGEKKGADSILFSGRVHNVALKPRAYRAVIFATDAAGNVSSHHHLSFTIDD